jgi:peptidoglycan/LPS O-acetylase OafA/YrhL
MDKVNQFVSPDANRRDDRLDLVKAISICLVLVWHLRPFKVVVGATTVDSVKTANIILTNLYFHITLIAVPLFILTSLFLLFQKLQSSSLQYLLKRCRRLFEIFVFWSVVQFLLYYPFALLQAVRSKTPFSWQMANFRFDRLFVGTQPVLPLIGDSVFYFLLIVLELTILAYFLLYWKSWGITTKMKDVLAFAAVGLSLIYFELLNFGGQGVPYWRLDGFLVYIPIAYLFLKTGGKLAHKYVIALYGMAVLLGVQDIWLTPGQDSAIYARAGIVCGAVAVFSSCLNLRDWQAAAPVKFLSKFSLGIFALHKYWQFFMLIILPKLFEVCGITKELLAVDVLAVAVAALSVALTFGSVYGLSLTPLRKFIQ